MGVVFLFFTVPLILRARRAYLTNRIWRELELEEMAAELKGSKALNFGNHPKQNLVKGRRTVEDEWCEFLSKKHEECAKLNGSGEPLCDVFKNGKPKQVFVEGRSILRVKGIVEDYYFSGDAN